MHIKTLLKHNIFKHYHNSFSLTNEIGQKITILSNGHFVTLKQISFSKTKTSNASAMIL
jgi:hypothetical protein